MNSMPDFLASLHWREAWLTLQSSGQADLPPYLGATLRGALGHLLRSELCDGSGCGHDCQRPDTCRYFSLFERSRSAEGHNVPKPLILISPHFPLLESVALGGPVNLPLRTAPPKPPECVPQLRDESRLLFEPGSTLRFGLRILGPAAQALPAILDAVAHHGLNLAGTPFHLRTAHGCSGELLYDNRFPSVPVQLPALQYLKLDGQTARRIRIVFFSPMLLKIGREPIFDPVECAARFFEHAMVQAAQAFQLMGEPRLPWLPPPSVAPVLLGHRLFHYLLPRHSYRQEKWLDFDGLVGYLDLEGDLSEGLPYARSAEILHFGQKATFGLGHLRVLILE